ncbi:transport protein [Ceratobasidium theobromae]|uniref:Transport protein n=1 Tax=Ceratobasidium theobromae TaxID=1582974 RepID=A0A5N5QMS5_9AGAM|nr:transport protein [Ceratobasidium theobromae]
MSGLPVSSSSSSIPTATYGRSRSNSMDIDARPVKNFGTTSQPSNTSMSKVLIEEITIGEGTPLLGGGERMRAIGCWRDVLTEIRLLMRYSVPVICVVSVISIGHLSTKMLAGSALASLTVAVTGASVIQGFASALDSLLPQAWTSGNPTHVGLWAQRMVVLMAFLIMPIAVLWQNIEPVLLLLGQDPEVAGFAGLYLKLITLQLPGYALNAVLRRYFQAQGLLHVPTTIIAVVAPLNVALNYLLVQGPEPVRLGFIGAPIATSISVTLTSAMYLIYGVYFAPHTAWHPITSQSLTSLPKLLRLGSAGVAQVAAEWWSWELMSLTASQLGPTALAAQSVIMMVATTTYNIQFSVGIAVAVRTGNLLGSKDSWQAHTSARAATGLTLLGGVTLGSIMFAFRHKIAYIFINDDEVASLVASVLPIVSLYQVVDGLASVETGILRACGKLGVSATVNFVAYYVIGLPLGFYLALWCNMGLKGVWIGLATAILCAASTIWMMVLRLDWDVEVREAKERIETGVPTADDDSRV